jgi:predicted tellurium resistance membrane protein TerC
MINDFGTMALLIGLELILGVDNVLVISLLVARLPKADQDFARKIGLGAALLARLLMLFGASALVQMRDPVFMGLSWRDLLLMAGGLFLLYKAVTEIHHTVEMINEKQQQAGVKSATSKIIFQILLLDIVFSLDSVITAVGMTNHMWVIVTSVVLSFVIVMAFAKKIGDFLIANPGLKILALSFLVTIGVTLFMESLHTEIPKAYIYLPMGFALCVELLQMRHGKNLKMIRK